MCGRYYMDFEAEESVHEFLYSAGNSLRLSGSQPFDNSLRGSDFRGSITASTAHDSKSPADAPRDVLPSDEALLISGSGSTLCAEHMRWGFPAVQPGRLLINARAETALTKPTFSDSVQKRRCVIPAAGFYEWDKAKNKVTFTLPEAPCLFMAGFFRPFGNDIRFIILTTAANDSMLPVHDRMPLILPKSEIADWILAPGKTAEYLRRTPPLLHRRQEYEQMTLPFI